MPSTGFELLARALPATVPPVLRGILSTCAIRVINRGVRQEFIDAERPFIGVVWHKDFLFVLDYFRRRKIAVMVSRSRDGELVSRVLRRMGYRTVRGSSSAGGREALTEVAQRLREGFGAAIIADGPRGPARTAKIGCVAAARDSGAPMIPFGCHMEPNITLRNWDRTLVPRPFSRIVIAFGDPVWVPAGASREQCEAERERMDRRMAVLEATCRADAAAG